MRKQDRQLRLKKLLERQLDPKDLEHAVGAGQPITTSSRGSRYCTTDDPR